MSATAAAFAGSSRVDRINAAAPCDTLELAKTMLTMLLKCQPVPPRLGAAENTEME
jgi:hypothetical protein